MPLQVLFNCIKHVNLKINYDYYAILDFTDQPTLSFNFTKNSKKLHNQLTDHILRMIDA